MDKDMIAVAIQRAQLFRDLEEKRWWELWVRMNNDLSTVKFVANMAPDNAKRRSWDVTDVYDPYRFTNRGDARRCARRTDIALFIAGIGRGFFELVEFNAGDDGEITYKVIDRIGEVSPLVVLALEAEEGEVTL